MEAMAPSAPAYGQEGDARCVGVLHLRQLSDSNLTYSKRGLTCWNISKTGVLQADGSYLPRTPCK